MIQVRGYGASGPTVILLHGGPGAPGTLAPVARNLAKSFRVLEPLQRRSGDKPLTVARHVADLHEVIESMTPNLRPALVGHSWGAMLALAYACEHIGRAASLALVACGTFDANARNHLRRIREGRMSDELRLRLERLTLEFPDPDERLRVAGDLLIPVYSYDTERHELAGERCDARGFEETWRDEIRLQETGVHPAAFAAIAEPILMLHGADDPHPGRLIAAGLAKHLPRIEYKEWERCGHYPWLERSVTGEFFDVLREWISLHQ